MLNGLGVGITGLGLRESFFAPRARGATHKKHNGQTQQDT
jgi:hypothetical protein